MDYKKEIEKRYEILNNEDKEKLIKQDKKSFIIINSVLTSFFSLLTLIFVVLIFVVNSNEDKYLFLGFSIVMALFGVISYFTIKKISKKTDEQRIRRQLKNQILNEQNISSYGNSFECFKENITNVVILDSFTEYTDKLHAVLNYQEIIQTRYYKFKIEYKNGNSEIITEKEGTVKCNNLLKLVNIKADKSEKQLDKAEELREYKKLLDDGVISEEDYEAKKKQILGL